MNLRYHNTDTSIMVTQISDDYSDSNYAISFKTIHEREFGFNFHEREILIDNVRVRSIGVHQTVSQMKLENSN